MQQKQQQQLQKKAKSHVSKFTVSLDYKNRYYMKLTWQINQNKIN